VTPTAVVIGAGLAGLSAALTLVAEGDGDVAVFEREERIGGHARSVMIGGYIFDEGPHILFPSDEEMREWILDLLGPELCVQRRSAYIVHERYGAWTRFPFQTHLHGLPLAFVRDCLAGLVAAAERRARGEFRPRNYDDWVRGTFGDVIADEFMLPYARKLWTVDPSTMGYAWVDRRVPTPDVARIIEGALHDNLDGEGAHREFWYPEQGGIETLPRALAATVVPVATGTALVEINLRRRKILLSTGERVRFEHLFLSLPLNSLPRYVASMPDRVREACGSLDHQGVCVVNVGVARERITDAHWLYFYEDAFPFYRASFPMNFSPGNAPPGHSSISLECAFPSGRPPDTDELAGRCVDALRRIELLPPGDEPELVHTQMIEPAYPIQGRSREASVATVRGWLDEYDVHMIGRFGEWAYLNMDEAMASGVRAARAVLEARRGRVVHRTGKA
jgi:protoporphyrinogen oxidase